MPSNTYRSKSSLSQYTGVDRSITTSYVPAPISLSDAYVLSQEIPPPTVVQAEARVRGYLTSDTLDGGLSWTGVMDAFVEPPENHAKGRIHVPRVPVGAIVLIVSGLTLMAFGILLNEPVSWFLFGLVH